MPLPTRQNTPHFRSQGLHCAIGDDLYRLVALQDAQPIIRTAPLQPPRIDTTSAAEEVRPEYGTIFSLADFTGGEGRDFAHRRNATDRDATRYWDSSGVDTSRPEPGNRTFIRLLHETNQITTGTGTVRLVERDGVLYATDGTSVKRTADPLVAVPTISTEDPHAGQGAVSVLDLAFLGDVLHAALGASGIHQRTSGGVWSHWSDLAATRVWLVKGRIVASTGTGLYEAKSAAGSTLLHTLDTGYVWTAVVDVGSHVLASATDGHVYAFTFDEGTPTLAISSRTPISDGPVTAMASLPGAGLVFYALAEDEASSTTASIHRASVASNGTLTDAATIREFVHASDNQIVSSILVDDEEVWFGQVGELWRYDLVTAGRNRDLAYGSDVAVTSLVAIADRIFAGLEGQGVHRQETTYVTSGWLITPLVDHASGAEKSWAGLFMDAPSVTSGGALSIYVSTDPEAILDPTHFSWKRIKHVTAGFDTEESSLTLQSRYLAIKIVVESSNDQTYSPQLRSVSTRSFPGPGDIILTLPINTSDQVEVPGRRSINVPGLGRLNYERLKGIEGQSLRVELFDPNELVQGLVEEVSSQLLLPDAKGSLTVTTVVRVRGRRIAQFDTSNVIGLLGTEHLLATTPVLAEVA